jgi:hypothetical protein
MEVKVCREPYRQGVTKCNRFGSHLSLRLWIYKIRSRWLRLRRPQFWDYNGIETSSECAHAAREMGDCSRLPFLCWSLTVGRSSIQRGLPSNQLILNLNMAESLRWEEEECYNLHLLLGKYQLVCYKECVNKTDKCFGSLLNQPNSHFVACDNISFIPNTTERKWVIIYDSNDTAPISTSIWK